MRGFNANAVLGVNSLILGADFLLDDALNHAWHLKNAVSFSMKEEGKS